MPGSRGKSMLCLQQSMCRPPSGLHADLGGTGGLCQHHLDHVILGPGRLLQGTLPLQLLLRRRPASCRPPAGLQTPGQASPPCRKD